MSRVTRVEADEVYIERQDKQIQQLKAQLKTMADRCVKDDARILELLDSETDLTTKLAEADAVIRDAQQFIDGDESLQGLEMAIADYLTRPINNK